MDYNKQKYKISCLNCNKKGHIKKNCKFPLNSYGIILYKIVDNELYLIMIQRKYSYSLISLLLNKYYDDDILNESKLINIISDMPYVERNYIKNHTFNYLWNKIWIWENPYQKFMENNEKYQYFLDNYLYLLNITPIKNIETEWEFPKGKRLIHESFLQCAIRECVEETNIIPYVKHHNMYRETFTGTNNVLYSNNYYLSNCYDKYNNIYYNYNNILQNTEIRKISWFSIKQVFNKIRHFRHKVNLLNTICREISQIENIKIIYNN